MIKLFVDYFTVVKACLYYFLKIFLRLYLYSLFGLVVIRDFKIFLQEMRSTDISMSLMKLSISAYIGRKENKLFEGNYLEI